MTITIPTPLEVTATMEGAEISIDLSYPVPVTVHADLTGRDAADSHPIAAITGLSDALEEALDIPIGRLDLDHTDTAFVAADWNTYMEADDTGGAVTLNIPAGSGKIGQWIIIRKVGDINNLTITADDTLVGDNLIKTQDYIIVIQKVTAERYNLTGGVS